MVTATSLAALVVASMQPQANTDAPTPSCKDTKGQTILDQSLTDRLMDSEIIQLETSLMAVNISISGTTARTIRLNDKIRL